MNADRTPGVDAGISAGAMIAWLDDAGWTLVGTGILFLAVAGALLYAGVRPVPPAAPAAPAAREWVETTA